MRAFCTPLTPQLHPYLQVAYKRLTARVTSKTFSIFVFCNRLAPLFAGELQQAEVSLRESLRCNCKSATATARENPFERALKYVSAPTLRRGQTAGGVALMCRVGRMFRRLMGDARMTNKTGAVSR